AIYRYIRRLSSDAGPIRVLITRGIDRWSGVETSCARKRIGGKVVYLYHLRHGLLGFFQDLSLGITDRPFRVGNTPILDTTLADAVHQRLCFDDTIKSQLKFFDCLPGAMAPHRPHPAFTRLAGFQKDLCTRWQGGIGRRTDTGNTRQYQEAQHSA